MTSIRMAFPAIVLLFTLSMSSAGQTFVETPGVAVAPRLGQSQPQSPAESSVIVVKPELTDEQLADLYMARKDYREAALSYKRLVGELRLHDDDGRLRRGVWVRSEQHTSEPQSQA